MPRDELRKHTLNLREGDWDYLVTVFRPQGVDVSFVVRKIVSNYVDELRQREGPQADAPRI